MKPTSSKGRSHWKKVEGTIAGGIVIPKGAILVNQGLRKVKLEEDFIELKPELPVSMEIEQGVSSRATTSDAVSCDVESATEEYQVTKVEVDIPNIPMSSEVSPAPNENNGHYDHGSSNCCINEEIGLLKTTVKKLKLQIDKQNEAIKKQDEAIKKQNEVIGEMKSFIRNIGLSMATYSNVDEEEENSDGGRHGNSKEFPTNDSGSTSNDLNLLKRPSGSYSPPSQDRVTVDASEKQDSDNSLIGNGSGSRSGGIDNDDNMTVDGEDVGGNEDCSKEHNDHAGQGTSEQIHCGSSKKNHQMFKCHLCPKVFKCTSSVKAHISSLHKRLQFKCAHCSGIFTQKSILFRHERRVHRKGGPPTQQCKICGIHLIKSEKGLQAHMGRMHKNSETSKRAKTAGSHIL